MVISFKGCPAISTSTLWLTGELIRWISIDEDPEIDHCQELNRRWT
jgi:hypothetical protein